MLQLPYVLNSSSREAVLEAVKEVCRHRGWPLLAGHVRSSHVHVVVEADIRPEKALNDFKACASRSLNYLGFDEPGRKRWAHHGSTRWLWRDRDVQQAIRYVIDGQSEPMAGFIAEVI